MAIDGMLLLRISGGGGEGVWVRAGTCFCQEESRKILAITEFTRTDRRHAETQQIALANAELLSTGHRVYSELHFCVSRSPCGGCTGELIAFKARHIHRATSWEFAYIQHWDPPHLYVGVNQWADRLRISQENVVAVDAVIAAALQKKRVAMLDRARFTTQLQAVGRGGRPQLEGLRRTAVENSQRSRGEFMARLDTEIGLARAQKITRDAAVVTDQTGLAAAQAAIPAHFVTQDANLQRLRDAGWIVSQAY